MREAVIVSTARTPIGKAYRGAFNATGAQALASLESVRNGSLASLLERSGTPGRAA